MKTIKTKVIAIVVAAAILLAATVTTVVVLVNSDGLDNMKDKNFSADYTFGGVEIVEEDGLFYLTRDGKKLSKTGYASLMDVNSYYADSTTSKQINNSMLLYSGDFEIYDWFLARKTDVDTYFLVNTQGKELAIEGSDLVLDGTYLPFLKFKSTLTGKFGVVSLGELDSTFSSNAGEEISLNMYDEIELTKLSTYSLQYDIARAKSTDVSSSAAISYTYADRLGKLLFISPNEPAALKKIELSLKDTVCYYYTADEKIYRADGTLIASDVEYLYTGTTEDTSEWLVAYCTPEDQKLDAAANAKNAFYKVISKQTEFELKATEYILGAPDTKINGSALVAEMVEQNAIVPRYAVFSLIDGKSFSGYTKTVADDTVPEGLLMATSEENNEFSYHYFDLESGARLLVSKYDDMKWTSATGKSYALVSDSEKAARNAELLAAEPTKTDLPEGYVHFVKAGAEEKTFTLAKNQSVQSISVISEKNSYKIVTNSAEQLEDGTPYNSTSEYLYLPFSDEKSASYDTIQALPFVFDENFMSYGVAIGTDYVGGKFDFIDLVNGKVVHTVSAAGADMAKTKINHVDTLVLAADSNAYESTVAFAVFSVTKQNDNGEVLSTDYLTLTRGTPLTEEYMYSEEKSISNPIKVKNDYGRDLFADRDYKGDLMNESSPFVASEYYDYSYYGYYVVDKYSKYLTVTTSKWSTDIYALSEAPELEKVATVPYEIVNQVSYGDTLDDVHFVVKSEDGKYGLVDKNGTQILAPVYESVESYGEYIVARRQSAYGMFKYNAEKGKTKQVLDFEYTACSHIMDDYFVLTDNTNQRFLFEGDELIKKDAVTSSTLTGTNYSFNKETGKLQYNKYFTVNIDGKYYIARGNTRDVVYDEFASGIYDITAIKQADVKIVNLRNADGTLIESTVIYGDSNANHKSFVEFKLPDDSNWYTSGIKAQQTTPASKADIYNTASNVVNFYKAPTPAIIP